MSEMSKLYDEVNKLKDMVVQTEGVSHDDLLNQINLAVVATYCAGCAHVFMVQDLSSVAWENTMLRNYKPAAREEWNSEVRFEASAPVQNVNELPTKIELNAFLARSARIVREKLPKAGIKEAEASVLVKNYLFKTSGAKSFKQITKSKWESMLSCLERLLGEKLARVIKAADCPIPNEEMY